MSLADPLARDVSYAGHAFGRLERGAGVHKAERECEGDQPDGVPFLPMPMTGSLDGIESRAKMAQSLGSVKDAVGGGVGATNG